MNTRHLATTALAVTLTTLAFLPTTATGAPAPQRLATAQQADPAYRATTYKATLVAAAKNLRVAAEHRDGYDRDLYKHWTDADADGCDTRDEVLIAEATTDPAVGTDCSLTNGAWFSYYDKETTTDPSTFDVDHMVPLAEAHDSGAYRWTADTRMRFANDLTDKRALVAVTASSNRSKSDQDPREWMPQYAGCRYIREWVAIKTRWRLVADGPEKTFLVNAARTCPTATIKVTKAKVETITTDEDPVPNDSAGLVLTRIDYDPPGADDAANLNNELVVITNPTNATVDLAGWTLTDAASASYTLPAKDLASGGTVRVHSGTGTNTTADLYAGWSYVWNNSGGDTATLTQPNGTVADTCTYTPTTTGTHTC